MGDTGAAKAYRADRVAPDHLPVCPECGNLCGKVEKWSPCCGRWLRAIGPNATELHVHAMLNRAAQSSRVPRMQSAPKGEDVQAARERED